MILYFSGTGNSEYTAKRIGNVTGDRVVNLFEKIRNNDFSEMHSESPWVIAVPTYAWRIPRIVQRWIENTTLAGNKKIYFVMTCGSNIGNAGKYLEKLCTEKKMNYLGCMGITMPENYIAMFSVPTPEKAVQIIRQAECVIDKAALLIQKGENFPPAHITFADNMSSGIVNELFYPMFVHAKKFYATDACISCGICVNLCPLNNIRLEKGKPVWGKDCTHCMSCICRCPKESIEYGRRSKGQVRYLCSMTGKD